MRLLFIKLKHIGDALLLTPTLTAVRARHPDAEIWVLVRKGTERILSGCPAIDEVLLAAPPERWARGLVDWRAGIANLLRIRGARFDWVFELGDGDRGRWVAALSGARTAATGHGVNLDWLARNAITHFSPHPWHNGHRVAKDYRTVGCFLPLPEEIPDLCFVRERTLPWPGGDGLEPFVVLHPGTRWLRKRWPSSRWMELGNRLGECGWNIVLSCGPDPAEIELSRELAAGIRGKVVSTLGTAGWAELAGLLYRAGLFVGVDTAAMHLAAACGCPTVAIFGPSVVDQWRPWKVSHRVVTADSPSAKTDEPNGITAVSVDAVWDACRSLWCEAGVTEKRVVSRDVRL
ncbi:MAG: glycosyltransferase family 9 protein [Verrucomicrobia bacterium]|nr:glycosyltransferase family 9 protein [Verrucomicrobiota bacterium]